MRAAAKFVGNRNITVDDAHARPGANATRPDHDIDKEVIARVAARYPRTGTRVYVRAKLGGDPICEQIIATSRAMGGCGDVVDVGCGRGQMGVLLLDLGLATSVYGFDHDEDKIEQAIAASRGDSRFCFCRGDARTKTIPRCDTALMLDVLHYLTDDEQSALVERAASAASRLVVIRELDPDRGWRSTATRMQEGLTTFFRYNVGARVRIRPIAPVVQTLAHAGFDVKVAPSWRGTPFANVALVACRRA
jgi:SAM-dependent methyltransferase